MTLPLGQNVTSPHVGGRRLALRRGDRSLWGDVTFGPTRRGEVTGAVRIRSIPPRLARTIEDSGARGRPPQEDVVAISWYPALELGIPELDAQHRELFRRIDLLVEAMMQRRGPDALASLFDFLGQYVYEHFSAEEALMRQHGYPHLPEHQAEHKRFIEDLRALQREYTAEGATALLLVKVNGRVSQWLAEHIARTDKAFGAHVKAAP
ncbi:MAG TPA: hemerythrin family protein [Anaeromyxobacteraceae bacterium]|nr:hemerythrin family protein [Anaeromyxobacteraceae bacterium]